jgi:hypothetical protein
VQCSSVTLTVSSEKNFAITEAIDQDPAPRICSVTAEKLPSKKREKAEGKLNPFKKASTGQA